MNKHYFVTAACMYLNKQSPSVHCFHFGLIQGDSLCPLVHPKLALVFLHTDDETENLEFYYIFMIIISDPYTTISRRGIHISMYQDTFVILYVERTSHNRMR